LSLKWFDVREWGVEGKGWTDTLRYYDRLPGRAEKAVRPEVWALSRSAAGMCCGFVTDSPRIWCRWKVQNQQLGAAHTPATAVSGVDLYAKTDAGAWNWAGVSKPASYPVLEEALLEGVPPVAREYRLYLPIANPVEQVEIGVEEGAQFAPLAPRSQPPLVFYGTSIVHGYSASRAGMTHSAILGRRLDVPVINLGFSGQGKMDLELASYLAELPASVYVIDCLPNMDKNLVTARAVPFMTELRRRRPATPIVLVEDRTWSNAVFRPSQLKHHEESRAALQQAYASLLDAGVTNLHYVAGEQLLGGDGEATVDGSHPTDLGFMRMADVFAPVLAPFLAAK
jgi:hypothetical protein